MKMSGHHVSCTTQKKLRGEGGQITGTAPWFAEIWAIRGEGGWKEEMEEEDLWRHHKTTTHLSFSFSNHGDGCVW